MTTNQDGPPPDDFAMKVWREAVYTYGGLSIEGSRGEMRATRVLSEAFDKVRAEERAGQQSAAPDGVVEAILYNIEQVCGPLSTEPCVIPGDDDRSVLASAIRADMAAATPAIRAQAVAEERARIVAWLRKGFPGAVPMMFLEVIADALEQGAHDNG